MYLYELRGREHYNGRPGQRAPMWLQAKVRERGLQLWPRLNDGPVCDAQHR